MRELTRFLSCLLAVFVGTLSPQAMAQEGADLPRNMVVMIEASPVSNPERRSIGAGVIVGYDAAGQAMIATARHVVFDPFAGPMNVVVSHRSAPNKTVIAKIVKLDFHKDLDLAVIAADFSRIDRPTNLEIGALRDIPEIGDNVMHIGHTEGKPWAESPLTEKVGMHVPGKIVIKSNFGGPGLSGGAALDTSGRIIGIALSDDRSIISILPLRVIAEEMKLHGLPFLLQEGKRRVARLDTEAALSIINSAKSTRDGSNQGQGEAITLLLKQGYDFAGADLSGIFLGGSEMEGANFKNARLELSDLEGAILSGANMSGVDLRFAVLKEAKLPKAILSDSYGPFLQARSADFSGADLSGSLFVASDLRDANFSGANLTGAVFSYANLKGANFSHANLTDVHFFSADLESANFKNALFKNTNMLAARLSPFELEVRQRAGTCQTGVGNSRAEFRLWERWQSTKYNTGYESKDLNNKHDFPLVGADMSFLRACEKVPHEIQGYFPTGPSLVRVALDRTLLQSANRKQDVMQQLQGLFDRYKDYGASPTIYGPLEP